MDSGTVDIKDLELGNRWIAYLTKGKPAFPSLPPSPNIKQPRLARPSTNLGHC